MGHAGVGWVGYVGVGGTYRGGVGYVGRGEWVMHGWGGVCHVGVGWGVVGHVGVGYIM